MSVEDTQHQAEISPNGKYDAVAVRVPNFEKNIIHQFIYIYDVDRAKLIASLPIGVLSTCCAAYPDSTNPSLRWSPNSHFLAYFVKKGDVLKVFNVNTLSNRNFILKIPSLQGTNQGPNLQWIDNTHVVYRAAAAEEVKKTIPGRQAKEQQGPTVVYPPYGLGSADYQSEGENVVEMSLGSGSLRVLLPATIDINDFDVSPSGKQLVFSAPNRGALHLFIYTFNTRQIRALKPYNSYEWLPTWSPDGKLLAVATEKSGVELRNVEYAELPRYCVSLDPFHGNTSFWLGNNLFQYSSSFDMRRRGRADFRGNIERRNSLLRVSHAA